MNSKLYLFNPNCPSPGNKLALREIKRTADTMNTDVPEMWRDCAGILFVVKRNVRIVHSIAFFNYAFTKLYRNVYIFKNRHCIYNKYNKYYIVHTKFSEVL
jgi:hypothetical protein